ncbi:unnamed protein product [Urochloa decumbens]|uniref:Chitin-binding type-1 domain-containing protein n=1 Tax=Urochloa decumbens TaxID=240449 RepID=A0ABC9BK37_9POAL
MASLKAATLALKVLVLGLLLLAYAGVITHAQPTCGRQVGGARCSDGFCCSYWGYCGPRGSIYCSTGCQSGPCS